MTSLSVPSEVGSVYRQKILKSLYMANAYYQKKESLDNSIAEVALSMATDKTFTLMMASYYERKKWMQLGN